MFYPTNVRTQSLVKSQSQSRVKCSLSCGVGHTTEGTKDKIKRLEGLQLEVGAWRALRLVSLISISSMHCNVGKTLSAVVQIISTEKGAEKARALFS